MDKSISESQILVEEEPVKYENPKSYLTRDFSCENTAGKLIKDFKLGYKFLKKYIKKYVNTKLDKNFTNIVYLTADCPFYMPNVERIDSPIDYISKIRNQYPDTNIVLLIPIIGLNKNTKISKKISIDVENNFFNLEKSSISFSFFSGNKTHECLVYKFEKNKSNVTIYGIYSPSFSYLTNSNDIKIFDKSVVFVKAARIAIKNLYKEGFKPDIVHSEFLPFFLGMEFEPKFPQNTKVLQIFDNFAKLEAQKQELFWSFINLADKQSLKKLFSDSYIQNCFSRLFNIPHKEIRLKMDDCINLIFDNYKIFHNTENGEYKNPGDVIFKHLNNRIKKLFPTLSFKNCNYYYPFLTSLKNCSFWAVNSKTYYNNLYEKRLASDNILREIIKTTDKSGYIEPVISIKNHPDNIDEQSDNQFDVKKYRENKLKNKKHLTKEFSADSIKTDFIDKSFFKNYENTKIYGYFDSFYDAPLLFANPQQDIFSEGTDILFSTILKLFERNRNIQVIFSVNNGLKQSYIKSVIDFLISNKIYMGRWVYIDGDVNLDKIFQASDMYLYPARMCDKSLKHLLGISYGCIPVVSNSGILNDTVTDIFDNISAGNGFKTKQDLLYENENTNLYTNYLEKALELYNNNPSSWNIIVSNAVKTNINMSFSKLERYNQIYENIL